MASYLTLFPTVETPLDESGKWLDGARDGTDWANPRVTSVGFCCGNQTGTQYADVVGLIKPAYLGFGNDQWAWGKVTNSISSGEEEVELRLRSAISSGSCTGYEILFPIANGLPSNNINIVSWDGALGSFTPLVDLGSGANIALVTGDVIAAQMSTWDIKVYVNGVQKGATYTDAGHRWASGAPGFGFAYETANDTLYGFSQFKAGDSASINYSTGTLAITGTATASITKADVVAGSKTVIQTLTNDTWLPA